MERALFGDGSGDDDAPATVIPIDPETCRRGLEHLAELRQRLADYRYQRRPTTGRGDP